MKGHPYLPPALPVIDLKTASDNEIILAVACHLDGWVAETRKRYGGVDNVKGWGKWIDLPIGGRERLFIPGDVCPCAHIPDYLNNADAVIALLEGRPEFTWSLKREACSPDCYVVTLHWPAVSAVGPTFCRAAVIALLRASGQVEVRE